MPKARCELIHCVKKQSRPATVFVNENLGDESFRTGICRFCADVLGVKDGDNLPWPPGSVDEKLKAAGQPRRITHGSAKAKARDLQKLVALKISELTGLPHGKDQEIESRPMGQTGTDIRLSAQALAKFPFSVECKAQESWSVLSWVEQAKANQLPGTEWLLVAKKKGTAPICIIDMETFFKILTIIAERHPLPPHPLRRTK